MHHLNPTEPLRGGDASRDDQLLACAHELRTPLTGIVGYADLLEGQWDELPEPDKLQYIGAIRRLAARMKALSESMLTGAQLVAVQPASPSSVVADAIESALQTLGPQAADIGVRCPPGLRALVDMEHLCRMLVNYVDNATKYGKSPIDVEARGAGPWTQVRVFDAGEGIDPARRSELFLRFSRLETESPATGFGLGLSLVRMLARANGGDAWYEPAADGRQRHAFVISLPEAGP